MLIAHRIALNPNNVQATYLARAAGTARFAYNWALHTIGIEDLHVKGMLKNRCLARAIADMGWAQIRRQIIYKAAMRGAQVHVADRWYVSSKTCSDCGEKCAVLPLSVRHWTCESCGSTHDRDINAAINLRSLAVSSTV